MEEHGEMNKILDGGDIRDRRGDRWDAVDKERELFPFLGDDDIPIDGIFTVDYVQIPPLRTDGGLVNRVWSVRQEGVGEDKA
jgi:hypothetical protein